MESDMDTIISIEFESEYGKVVFLIIRRIMSKKNAEGVFYSCHHIPTIFK